MFEFDANKRKKEYYNYTVQFEFLQLLDLWLKRLYY